MRLVVASLVVGWVAVAIGSMLLLRASPPSELLTPKAPEPFAAPVTSGSFDGRTIISVAFSDLVFRPMYMPYQGTITSVTASPEVTCGDEVVQIDGRQVVAECGPRPARWNSVWFGETGPSRFRPVVVVGQKVQQGELLATGKVAGYRADVVETSAPPPAVLGSELVIRHNGAEYAYTQGSSTLPAALLEVLASGGRDQETVAASLASPRAVSIIPASALRSLQGSTGCVLTPEGSSDTDQARVEVVAEEPGVILIEPVSLPEVLVGGARLDLAAEACA